MRRSHFAALPFCAAAFLACSAAPRGPESSSAAADSTTGLSAEAVRLWESYASEVTGSASLQAGCEPTRLSPPEGVPYRGVVVLFHGFTACPQQFFEMARPLVAEGFEVLLPLMPGEGRRPLLQNGVLKDDLSDLPTPATKQRYADLALRMTSIARATGGLHVVGGLSMGGMVATSALVQGGNAWTRGLLMSPYYSIPGFQKWVAKAAEMVDPTLEHSWGGSCVEDRDTTRLRAGMCDFQVQHVVAGLQMGEALARQTGAITAPVQVASVEADTGADDGFTNIAAQGMAQKSVCFFPKGVPHAYISPSDHTSDGLDMFWLPLLYQEVARFVADGTPFAAAGTSSEYGWPTCVDR